MRLGLFHAVPRDRAHQHCDKIDVVSQTLGVKVYCLLLRLDAALRIKRDGLSPESFNINNSVVFRRGFFGFQSLWPSLVMGLLYDFLCVQSKTNINRNKMFNIGKERDIMST